MENEKVNYMTDKIERIEARIEMLEEVIKDLKSQLNDLYIDQEQQEHNELVNAHKGDWI